MDELFTTQFPYLTGSADVAEATALIADYGEDAGLQAAARADRSRGLGNHIHFCRWRQIERLIHLLADDCVSGTLH